MSPLNNFWQEQTFYFLAVFLVIFFLSLRKRKKTRAFSVDSANELRGLAILGVVFAHLGYGLFWGTNFLFPLVIWGGVAVNLFFLASGFGLTASAFRRQLSIGEFYWRRLTKIIVPVWLSLSAFIIIDAIFLKRFYGWTEIWQSFLLFFPRADLVPSINSPLWFITPLVFFYLIFPIVFKKNKPFLSTGAILAMSFILTLDILPVSQQIKNFYATHFLAFPLGVLLAVIFNRFSPARESQNFLPAVSSVCNNKKLQQTIKNNYYWWLNKKDLVMAVVLLVLAVFAYCTAVYSGVGKSLQLEQAVSLITTFSLVLIFIFKSFEFRLLRFIGDHAFEIYLLHWPLLARYGFLASFLPPWLATLFALVLVVLLAYFFKLFNKYLEKLWF